MINAFPWGSETPPYRPDAGLNGGGHLRFLVAGADCSVNEALSIDCPHCGETFSLAFDVSEGSAEFVADCEVCCRPMTVIVRVTDGEIDGLEISAD